MTKEELLQSLSACEAPLFITGFGPGGEPPPAPSGPKYTLGAEKLGIADAKTMCKTAAEKSFEKHSLEPLYLKPARFELGK
jgi:hypothetical protein